MCIMTDSIFLFYLLGILCFDANFVICFRGRMTVPLAWVRVITAMAMCIPGYCQYTPMDQIGAYGLASLIFIYNTWFVVSNDDDLCECGSVGRGLVNRHLQLMDELEKK